MKIYQIQSRQPVDRPLFSPVLEKLYSLQDIRDSSIQHRLKILLDKKVPFFPPTMCPADAVDNELENILWVIRYYKSHNVKRLVLQEKMMGSRCVVILRESPQGSFAISKNGFVINHVDIEKAVHDLHSTYFVGPETILDCELLPWSAMGKGLIEKSFCGFQAIYENEAHYEQQFRFNDMWHSVQSLHKDVLLDFPLSKSDFIKKHGYHNYHNVKNFYDYSALIIASNKKLEYAKLFSESLSLYIHEYDVTIRPFAILKQGDKVLLPNNTIDTINSVTLDIEDVSSIVEFRQQNDQSNLEGIVVKPLNPTRNIAPYFKVRNREYLRLVYGPDYTEESKLHKLMKNKRIDNKLNQSIEQWKMCYDLLTSPSNIHESIFCKYFHKPELETDPRL